MHPMPCIDWPDYPYIFYEYSTNGEGEASLGIVGFRGSDRGVGIRAVQRSIHDAHGEDCTDAAEGDAMPSI